MLITLRNKTYVVKLKKKKIDKKVVW